MWANITAFVLSVIAFSISFGFMLYVGISISTNTGIRLFCNIGLTVVGKHAATVITSSPGLSAFSFNFSDVNADNANKFAEEPEFVVVTKLILKKSDNCFSNC